MSTLSGAFAVHPRRRGERDFGAHSLPHVAGSSPQARGTQDLATQVEIGVRFIPAGAGNAGLVWRTGIFDTVHPRRRGERAFHTCSICGRCGSSPQARGTLFL